MENWTGHQWGRVSQEKWDVWARERIFSHALKHRNCRSKKNKAAGADLPMYTDA